SKSTKMDCAVSGRSQAMDAVSSTGPTKVLNIRLNCRGSASLRSPQFGQGTPERSSFLARHAAASSSPFGRSSSRNRLRQLRHSRSEEHTSELQSHLNLVCRLLLEKKK